MIVTTIQITTAEQRPILGRLGRAVFRDALRTALDSHHVALHAAQTVPSRFYMLLSGEPDELFAVSDDVQLQLATALDERRLRGPTALSSDPPWWPGTDLSGWDALVRVLSAPVRDQLCAKAAHWHGFNTLEDTLGVLRKRPRPTSGLAVAPLPKYADWTRRRYAEEVRRRLTEVEGAYDFVEAA